MLGTPNADSDTDGHRNYDWLALLPEEAPSATAAYDWLATAKPLLVTQPAEPRAQLPESGLVRELDLFTAADAARAASVVDAAVTQPDESHAALVRRYFGDTTPGASMARFLDACDDVIRERSAALAVRAARLTDGRE